MLGSRRRRSLQKALVFATTVMLLCGIVVHAQDTTNLSGTVTDPHGKVIQGATVTATNTANGQHLSVNGGKSDQANVTLDGVDVNDQQNGLAFNSSLRVTLDSIQEFRVVTTNANAEQGRSSGAQISLVTKGGTNTFHGSAYEFNRNTLFEAN